MREIKESKIRIKNKKSKKEDTLSITRELEKTLNIGATLELENKRLKERKIKFVIKMITILIFIVIISSCAYYLFWLNKTYKVNEYANHAMISTSKTEISKQSDSTILFKNKSTSSDIGVIIIPAQKVQQKSYARLAKKLSQNNYQVFIPKLVFNSSIFSTSRIEKIIENNKDVSMWYVIGHSDSGNTALKVSANEKKVLGTVFLGSYVTGDDLKLINKHLLLIWGTNDGVLDFSKFNEYKKNLSENTTFLEIVGGNNSNFADIELLENDNSATINNEQQQKQAINSIVKFINKVSEQNR